MRFLKIILPVLALLIGSAMALADYDPSSPPEPGVNFTLTTRCTPSGSARSMTTSGTYAFGTIIQMDASPNTGFRFVQWEDSEGNVVSANARFKYTMPPRNIILTAKFEYDPSAPEEPGTPEFGTYSRVYLKCYPTDGGSFNVSSGQTYEVGSTQKFQVNAKSNYRFVNWTRDGEVISTSTSIQYKVLSGDQTLIANFVYEPAGPIEPEVPHIPRKLTLVCNPTGAGSLTGGGTFNQGTIQKVSISNVNQYYSFVNWTDESGEVISESRNFNFTIPGRNVTLTANFSYDYNPENPPEPDIPNPEGSIADNMVLYPRFAMYDDTHVMILCETEGSTIYYTTDGSDPSSESNVYTEPFYVEKNLLVKAIAMKDGMENSPIRSFQVTSYKAAAPYFTFINHKVEIKSDTPEAIIRYTLDFSEPNDESEIYTTPLEPEENCRIKAYASKEGLTDSRVSVYVYRQVDYMMGAPTFSLNQEGKLVIIPPVKDATIYYATHGDDPTESGIEYTTPITLEGNDTIRAYATHANYFDSPIAEYVADSLKTVKIVMNYRDRNIMIDADVSRVSVTIDGNISIYATPVTIGVSPTMRMMSVVALAENSDIPVSKPVTRQLVFHNAPLVTFDGHAVSVRVDDNETIKDEAEVITIINGNPADSRSEITEFGDVYAVVESDLAFRSDSTVMAIDYFNTGSIVGARNGHRLHEAFEGWNPDYEYTSLTVVGDINRQDLEFLAEIRELTTLKLAPNNMLGNSFSKALFGSRIETVSIDVAPEGLLCGMPRLSTVVWRNASTPISELIFGESVYPNLLLWVTDKDNAPANVRNIVIYSTEDTNSGEPQYGYANNISLTSGHSFKANWPLTADSVKFVKTFSQPTQKDVCRGWETIALPFNPTSIHHETKGYLLPYTKWEEGFAAGRYGDEGPKPFWIFAPTTEGWDSVSEIHSGEPYIISMPNNSYYLDAYNIVGDVTFSAENVMLGNESYDYQEERFPYVRDWIGGTRFNATFMPVEEDCLSLNSELTYPVDGIMPGSEFNAESTTLPFEAYVTGHGSVRSIPVFQDKLGVGMLPGEISPTRIVVEIIGNGAIRILSQTATKIDISTLMGIRIRNLQMKAGEYVKVEGLTPGIYIVAGQKVMIK